MKKSNTPTDMVGLTVKSVAERANGVVITWTDGSTSYITVKARAVIEPVIIYKTAVKSSLRTKSDIVREGQLKGRKLEVVGRARPGVMMLDALAEDAGKVNGITAQQHNRIKVILGYMADRLSNTGDGDSSRITVGDVASCTYRYLIRYRNLGTSTMFALECVLGRYGMKLLDR